MSFLNWIKIGGLDEDDLKSSERCFHLNMDEITTMILVAAEHHQSYIALKVGEDDTINHKFEVEQLKRESLNWKHKCHMFAHNPYAVYVGWTWGADGQGP